MKSELTLVEHAATAAQDVRLAIRRICRTPAIAAAIVLTLALGLGGAAAIFTASGAALVGPLPYENPDRLVHLWEVRAGTEERSPTSYSTLLDWRVHFSSLIAIEGYDPANFTVGAGDGARMLRGAEVSAGFFRLLGVRMSAGRDFAAGEDATVGAGVAVVTDNFASAVAGGVALGRTIEVNGAPLTVIGVLPSTFHFALLQDAEVFVPLAMNEQRRTDRSQRSVQAVARLRHGALVADARDEIARLMVALARDHPDALVGRTVHIVPLRDALLGNMKPVLAGLLGAVGLLLVIMSRRKLRFARTGETEWEVAGIVGDVQVSALDADSPPVIYLSHLQAAENRLMVVIRADVGVAAAARQLRSISLISMPAYRSTPQLGSISSLAHPEPFSIAAFR